MIRNILHNAIKFSPGGAAISVAVFIREKQVYLLTTDTGPVFAQTSRQTPFDQHGTSLGLQPVRDLMQANAGDFSSATPPTAGPLFGSLGP